MKTYKITIKTDEIIDESEAKEIIINKLKSELDYKQRNVMQNIAREIVSNLVEQIATKEFKKELSTCVKNIINTFERSDLTYRDEYRKLLVDIAKKQEKLIEEKIIAVVNNGDTRQVYDALGDSLADKFITYIRNTDN